MSMRGLGRRSKAADLGVAKPAGVAELADAQDLGSCDASRGGSSPSARTTGVAQGGASCAAGAGLAGARKGGD